MNNPDARLDREEIVEQAVRAAQTGRLAVIIAEQPVFTGLLGDAAVMLMDSGVDVARLDAFEAHSSEVIRDMLCHAMDLEEAELMDGLRFRGETGNPFCLVIDSGECLDRKAFILLKTLLEQTAGGIGLLLAGEPDLASFIEEFGLAVSWRYELEPDYPLASEEIESTSSRLVLPWKHLAAAAGLALLVLLFWPGDDADQSAEVRTLALPVRPAEAPAADAAPTADEVEERFASTAVPQAGSASRASAIPETGSDRNSTTTSALPALAQDQAQTAQDRDEPAHVAPAPAAEPVTAAPREARQRPPVSPSTASVAPEPAQAPAQKKTTAGPDRPAPVATRDPALSGLDAELNYRQEDWLLALGGSEWLLQVALATTEDGARSLLDRLGRQRAAYYRAQRTGRNVYIVLAGPWPDREAAVEARATLPQDLRSLGPFPRQAATVQQEVVSGHP